MKFLSFIWANLWRKPLRTIFTLLSVVIGFVLFGLVLGLRANLRQMAASARADRIYTAARLDSKLTIAQLPQIARVPGVAAVGALDNVSGYYQRPGNNAGVMMLGPGMHAVFPELPLTAQMWQLLGTGRDGIYVSRQFAAKFGLKPGSTYPVIATGTSKSDGSNAWAFKVLGVVPDIPLMPVGFAVGNYDYLDQARATTDQGSVQVFWSLAKDVNLVNEVARQIDRTFANSPVPTRSTSEKVLLDSNGGGGSDAVRVLIALGLLGVVMIMLLTANAMRHSIRERTTELAVLKTLGFSNYTIICLVFVEAAVPCLVGCLCGLVLAAGTAALLPQILPTGVILPLPRVDSQVAGWGMAAGVLIAVVAAVLPVLRITRLDVAASLARH
jgi:putative ABC transport system permease protein